MAAEIREDYLESLAELTVASRPIIKTLTEIAQENVDNAPAVVDAIAQHSTQCPPNQKLPALYLIDSICKNNGEPYVSLFAPRIVAIFTSAFEVSSESTRIKLNEQFKTWTVPNPATDQPLFSHDILRALNDFMVNQQPGRSAAGGPPNSMTAPLPPLVPRSGGRLNQSALLVEINRIRTSLEQELPDQFIEKQLQMLDRYEAQASGVVDPKALPQIQTDLENLKVARDQYLSRNGGSRRRRDNRRDGKRVNRGGVDKAGNNGGPIGSRSRVPSASKNELAAMSQALDEPSPASDADTGAPNFTGLPPLIPLADMMKGLSSLPQLDLVTASQTDASSDQIAQLYAGGRPLQCSTCGYRFPDTEEGRAAKQAEMDWHFRANKDIREGRSRSRCLFLTIVQWIEYRDEDEVFGVGSQISGNDAVLTAGGAETTPVDLDKEREKYIEVPMDSNAVCPVCQEPHETSWSEEAENWVWMNTVDIGGLYFHATCYADPQNKDLVAAVLEEK